MSKKNTLIDTSKVHREDLIYLAGLIDGDGCFFISERISRDGRAIQSYTMNLGIACIEKFLIDWVHSVFGGSVHRWKKQPPRRDLYSVNFGGNRLTQITKLLLPFLKLKKPHAENMLKIRNTYDGFGGRYRQPSQEVIETRHQCYLISRKINSHKPLPKNLSSPLSSSLCSEEVQVN